MRGGRNHEVLRNLQLGRRLGNLGVEQQRRQALQGFQDEEGRQKLGVETVGTGYLAVTLP